MTREEIETFYADQAERVRNKIITPSLRRKYNEVVKTVLASKRYGSKVLDVGCQAGGLTNILAAVGYVCTGFDLSEGYLKYADMNSGRLRVRPNTTWVKGFAEDLDKHFKPKSFDVVILSSILEHVEDPTLVYEKAKGLVKLGGIVVVNVPIEDSFYSEEHFVLFDRAKIKECFGDCKVKKIIFKEHDPSQFGWYSFVWRNNG